MQDHYKETWKEIRSGIGMVGKIVLICLLAFLTLGFFLYLSFVMS